MRGKDISKAVLFINSKTISKVCESKGMEIKLPFHKLVFMNYKNSFQHFLVVENWPKICSYHIWDQTLGEGTIASFACHTN